MSISQYRRFSESCMTADNSLIARFSHLSHSEQLTPCSPFSRTNSASRFRHSHTHCEGVTQVGCHPGGWQDLLLAPRRMHASGGITVPLEKLLPPPLLLEQQHDVACRRHVILDTGRGTDAGYTHLDGEGFAADQHDKGDHAEAEHVHRRLVRPVMHHLRRHEPRRPQRACRVCTPSQSEAWIQHIVCRCKSDSDVCSQPHTDRDVHSERVRPAVQKNNIEVQQCVSSLR